MAFPNVPDDPLVHGCDRVPKFVRGHLHGSLPPTVADRGVPGNVAGKTFRIGANKPRQPNGLTRQEPRSVPTRGVLPDGRVKVAARKSDRGRINE